ncbi:FAD-binding oxidoreductase [Streptomyces sp. NPDC048664]|uniref:FAD-binding oxidoreductase n=1 Tax=Streptomyces sp. NPDC048664 TaxID=3154505 RepID=UPI00343270E4
MGKAAAALSGLRRELDGDVLAPGDPGYDQARAVFNARIDRHPAVIAQCEGTPDVVRAVRFARELDLKIAVRGGGHSVTGTAVCDNGLVVDLRRMRTVAVDPRSPSVRLGGGTLTAELDRATLRHALAAGAGRFSATGVAGTVLGGCTGWLDRPFGLAADALLAVDVVTADGDTVAATPEQEPDLFWALHGGGGNFGIATALTLRLHELPAFSAALLTFPPATAPEAVRAYRDLVEAGPARLGGAVLYTADRPWSPVCGVLVTYAGAVADLRALIRPLSALPHRAAIVSPMPYPGVRRLLDVPPGLRGHGSAAHLTALPDELADLFCARAAAMPAPTYCRYALFPLGGALAHGPAGHPAPCQDAAWSAHPLGAWADPADDERALRWADAVHDDVRPWRTGAVYAAPVADTGGDRLVAGLDTGTLARLERVKRRYDPDNVFRYNHNVRPA